MSRHPRLAAALLAPALLVLAACTTPPAAQDGPAATSTSGGQDAATEVTVGLTYVPDIQFAPFYVAAEKGYYEDAGLDVTLRHHGANEGLFTAISGGQEDVVVAGGDEMLQARSQGVPLLDVATLYQEYPVNLIVPADSDIRTAADLAGHKVGIPGPFGETYFGLVALLHGAGLSEDDVAVDHVGFTQQAALTAGHVDAVMGFVNNDAVRFAAAGQDVRTIPVTEGEVPLVGIGLGVLDATAQDRPDEVAAVVEATLRGVRDVVADPQEAVELSAAYVPDLGREDQQAEALATLEATVPLYGEGDSIGAQSATTWEAMVTLMQDNGLLDAPVDPAEAWTGEFLPGASN